ncbi:putative Zn-dependent peptidase [Salirhabdus euzebyi]|uniref:Putative Zn-dependent peptidase n=1 Tax=Salirhabdus euzebyi TaxID=394506 RepID=A0A841Q393_9BACI|nr:pitrilysin family protein [Salirhabdus euzebyi]MBB6452859.1 putative Zn-dependent peptidase [Salirhabdus euzebyi]
MTELKEYQYAENGYQLHIIPTKKFKTNMIMVRFLSPLRRENATKRALLPFVLQKGTKEFPSERLLRIKLDELYGAQLSVDSSKKGENLLITLRISFVNEKFIQNNTSLLTEVLHLLRQILLEPNGTEHAFLPELVAKEKNTLRQKIESIKDQKMQYANMRLIDEMCKGEPYETHVHGYLEDLDSVNENNLYDEFIAMIQHDQMDVYALGDLHVEKTKEAIGKVLTFSREPKHESPLSNHRVHIDEVKEIKEAQKIQQGKLQIGFRTNTTFKDDDYFALQIYNGLFGGFPHSKLFMNVREKHQLAYYAASRFESHKGLLLVFSGIAPQSFDKAKEIILEQVEEMKKGNFTEEQLEETKRLTVHQLKETLDNPYGIVELMYHQVLAEKNMSPEEMFAALEKVTKNDLIALAEKIELDTIYFLTSEGDQ